MGTNLQGYHLLWPDLPTFYNYSSLRAPPRKSCVAYACAPLTLYNSVGRATATQDLRGGGLLSTSRAFTAPFCNFPSFVRPRGSEIKER